MAGHSVWQVVAPTGLTALLSTGLAVAVNVATGDGPWWMWLAVALLTLGVFAASLWLQYGQSSTGSSTSLPISSMGIDLSDVEAAGGMIADGVDATGTAVKVDKGRFGGSLEFKNIRAGHGDASHP